MALEPCGLAPNLHIPHLTSPYTDQTHMENFQAIQRWADQLRVICTCNDCVEWTISTDGPVTDPSTTTSYTMDVAATVLSVTVSGHAIDSRPRSLIVLKNGSPIGTIVLPVIGGAFSFTTPINVAVVATDSISLEYAQPASTASAQFTAATVVGFIPWTNPDAIGSGNQYKVDMDSTVLEYPGAPSLDTDQVTAPGTAAPLALPDAAYPFTITNTFAGQTQVYAYIGYGATPSVARDIYVSNVQFPLTYSGNGVDPVYVTVFEAPASLIPGGFSAVFTSSAITASTTVQADRETSIENQSNPPFGHSRHKFLATWSTVSPSEDQILDSVVLHMGCGAHGNQIITWGGIGG